MNKEKIYDIIIIGGGASGLLSSILLKEKMPSFSILIIEKKSNVGEKLKVTGNHKCNISNENALGFLKVKRCFNGLGIDFDIDKEGRCYPTFHDASKLRDILYNKAKDLNIEFLLDHEVKSIKKDDLFNVDGYISKKLIISTGGKSYPKLGTTGDGYIFAKNFGHKVNTLIPGLTPIKVKEDISYLKGVRQKGKVSLYINDKLYDSEIGEIQFREDSISGICVMNLSNYVRKENKNHLVLDFTGFELNKIIKDEELILNCDTLYGWKDAQITCGGVDLKEIDLNTMESKIVNGLYFIGEVLDYSYKCGGYNLNNAWLNAINLAENI